MTVTTPDVAVAAARGTAVTLGVQALRVLLHVVSTVVLAKLLTPEDVGLVAMVVAVVGVSEIVRDLGLTTAAIQAKRLDQRQKSNLFWLNATMGAGAAVAVLVLARPIAALFDDRRLVAVSGALAGVYLLNGLAAQFRAEINRSLRFVALSACDLVPQLLALGLAVALAVGGAGYWSLVAQQLAYAGAGLLFAVGLARWRPGPPSRGSGTRPLIRFGLGVAGTQAVGYAVNSAPTVAIGAALGPGAAGIFNRASLLVVAPLSQIAAPLTRVAIPILSPLSDDARAFDRALVRGQLVGSYVTCTLFCLLMALAPPIVAVVLGPGWEDAAPVVAVLAVAGIFRSINQITYWAYLAAGMSLRQLRVYIRYQPIVVLTVLAGLPWGVTGVAVGYAAGTVSYWAVSLVAVRRDVGVDSGTLARGALLTLGRVGVPAGLAALVASRRLPGPWLQLGGGIAAAGAALVAVAILSPAVRRDVGTLVAFGRRAVAG